MEETETPTPDYIKGFNEGYSITKHLPGLSEQLANALSGSERSTGFNAGRDQQILDRDSRYPDWLRTDYLTELDQEDGPIKEEGKDDLEPEI